MQVSDSAAVLRNLCLPCKRSLISEGLTWFHKIENRPKQNYAVILKATKKSDFSLFLSFIYNIDTSRGF